MCAPFSVQKVHLQSGLSRGLPYQPIIAAIAC
jgi:hypothetical protein